jgi:hypothetical protein
LAAIRNLTITFLEIIHCPVLYERERKLGVVVRDTIIVGGGAGNNIFGLKVPRHWPLVLLIGVRLEFRINSTFFYFFNFNIIGVGGLHWNEI